LGAAAIEGGHAAVIDLGGVKDSDSSGSPAHRMAERREGSGTFVALREYAAQLRQLAA